MDHAGPPPKGGHELHRSDGRLYKALELDAANEDAMTGLATVYADLGDNKAAADMLAEQVADKDPNPRSLTSLANVYEQLKDYSLAAEMLRRALDQQPGNSELKMALAEDLLLSNQFDDALKLYQEAVAEDPKDIKAELRISQIYRQKQDFAKAREAADKAKEIDPNDLEVQYNDVNLLEAEGKIPDAIKTLKGILDATVKKSYSASEKSQSKLPALEPGRTGAHRRTVWPRRGHLPPVGRS